MIYHLWQERSQGKQGTHGSFCRLLTERIKGNYFQSLNTPVFLLKNPTFKSGSSFPTFPLTNIPSSSWKAGLSQSLIPMQMRGWEHWHSDSEQRTESEPPGLSSSAKCLPVCFQTKRSIVIMAGWSVFERLVPITAYHVLFGWRSWNGQSVEQLCSEKLSWLSLSNILHRKTFFFDNIYITNNGSVRLLMGAEAPLCLPVSKLFHR